MTVCGAVSRRRCNGGRAAAPAALGARAGLSILLLLALLLVTVGGARADAPSAPPSGHWDGAIGERVRVCLDILPHAGIRLTIFAPEERNPIVIDGSYQLDAKTDGDPDGDWNLTMTVAKIRSKELANCRKFWIIKERLQTSQLGVVFRPRGTIKLTLHLGCVNSRSTAHLCIVSARGTTTCRDLRSERTAVACKPSAPVRPDNDPNLKVYPPGG